MKLKACLACGRRSASLGRITSPHAGCWLRLRVHSAQELFPVSSTACPAQGPDFHAYFFFGNVNDMQFRMLCKASSRAGPNTHILGESYIGIHFYGVWIWQAPIATTVDAIAKLDTEGFACTISCHVLATMLHGMQEMDCCRPAPPHTSPSLNF